ncbi:plasmid segregation protein ParM domain-containing protein [Escherichia sp. HC-CC]
MCCLIVPISPDAVVTTNIAWQYSDVNVVAVHHALLTSGLPVSEVDIGCDYSIRADWIK